MKKTFFALTMVVVVAFTAAVGLCLRALNGASAVAAVDAGLKIVIDAGHGGIDGGVVGKKTGIRESDVNLDIAYELKDVLENMGFSVTMTRKTQAGLYDTTAKGFKRRDMEKRKEIIQAAAPDFVVSIHQNFYPSSVSRGAQAFFMQGDEKSQRLAELVQSKMNNLYARDKAKPRKAMRGDFFILRCYDCPSVLLECGFLSNAADETLLSAKPWQKKCAQSVAAALTEFLTGITA